VETNFRRVVQVETPAFPLAPYPFAQATLSSSMLAVKVVMLQGVKVEEVVVQVRSL